MKREENLREGTVESPGAVICEGCGEPVKELAQQDAQKLRRGTSEESFSPIRAFECPSCEAVIYSDEFILGRFVPPQFRALQGLIALPTGLGQGHVPLQAELAVLGPGEATTS